MVLVRSSKPFSTISYNSEAFLKGVLNNMVKAHRVAKWYAILHQPEADEAKAHYHVYVEPNGLLDTMALSEALREPDPKNPTKPLGCIAWKSSKLDDWILYVLHDRAYLASKGEDRQYEYDYAEMLMSDTALLEELEEDVRHAYTASEWAQRLRIVRLLDDGIVSPYEAVLSGLVPMNLASQLRALAQLRLSEPPRTDRGSHEGHE